MVKRLGQFLTRVWNLLRLGFAAVAVILFLFFFRNTMLDPRTIQVITLVIGTLRKAAAIYKIDSDPTISTLFNILNVLFPQPMMAAAPAVAAAAVAATSSDQITDSVTQQLLNEAERAVLERVNAALKF